VPGRGSWSRRGYSFQESELVDWLISRPDGSEEGNVVGKFLDERNARKGAADR
jgi:hypothetical protein